MKRRKVVAGANRCNEKTGWAIRGRSAGWCGEEVETIGGAHVAVVHVVLRHSSKCLRTGACICVQVIGSDNKQGLATFGKKKQRVSHLEVRAWTSGKLIWEQHPQVLPLQSPCYSLMHGGEFRQSSNQSLSG